MTVSTENVVEALKNVLEESQVSDQSNRKRAYIVKMNLIMMSVFLILLYFLKQLKK